jgi:hypothetical protein
MGSVLSSSPPLTVTEVASAKALDTLKRHLSSGIVSTGKDSTADRSIAPAVLSLSRGDFAMAS